MTSTSLPVSWCALCGGRLMDGASLCAGHHRGDGETGWAAVNRVMCDFFHRGIAAPRLGPAERLAGGYLGRAAEAACHD
jgi:hypothetical protein